MAYQKKDQKDKTVQLIVRDKSGKLITTQILDIPFCKDRTLQISPIISINKDELEVIFSMADDSTSVKGWVTSKYKCVRMPGVKLDDLGSITIEF